MSNCLGKINTGKSSVLFVFLVTLLAGCANSAAPGRSAEAPRSGQYAQEVGEQFLEAIDDAYTEQDVDTIASLLHDELSYEISVSQQGGPPQDMSLTKPALIQMLSQQISLISNFSIERSDVQVTALDNGNLRVQSIYRESMTMQGMNVNNEAEETIILEMGEDRMTAREIVANVRSTFSIP